MDALTPREIVQELRSHILEKDAGGNVDSALAALGSPEELAGRYLTDSLLARAAGSRSPVLTTRRRTTGRPALMTTEPSPGTTSPGIMRSVDGR